MQYFHNEVIYSYDIGNEDLASFVRKWHISEWEIKRIKSNEELLLRYKHVGKAEGNVNVLMNYKASTKKLKVTIYPLVQSYILFTIVPISYIALSQAQNLNKLVLLAPLGYLVFVILLLKINVQNARKKIERIIKQKLK